MTVAELIAELQKMPQDAIALGRGYEGGYDAITDVRAGELVQVKDQPWYYGEYQTKDEVKWTGTPVATVKAVTLL